MMRSDLAVWSSDAVIRLGLAATIVLTSLLVCSCGVVRVGFPPRVSGLNACLRRHGVAEPEVVNKLTAQEQAIPAAMAYEPQPIPNNVTRAQYQQTLVKCGAPELAAHLGRTAITSDIAKRQLLAIQQCLVSNGFRLPRPNFPGPGPVFDTTGVDLTSTRWAATVTGCETLHSLTRAQLERCMGARALRQSAMAGAAEKRLLELPRCLRSSTDHTTRNS